MPEILKLFPKPHSAGQAEFLTHDGSICCFAGKRWGKTLICGVRILERGFKDPGLYWWVGLSWKAASMKRAWRTMCSWHKKIWRAKGENHERYKNKTERELIFPDGLIIWFRTAENPESIQGEGVKGIIVDEIAFMNKTIWENYIEPCTIDFGAWVVMISSANGANWYDEFWESIKRGDRASWIAREYTTFDNPILMNNPKSKAKLDEIIKNAPPEVVAQEYWNKRIATLNRAFDPKAVKDCRKAGFTQLPRIPNTFYAAFVDASGGGQNSYSISVMHKELRDGQEIYIQDYKASKAFAHTKATTRDYAEVLKSYGVYMVTGDRYAGNWCAEEFLSNGIAYEVAELHKSDIYRDASIVVNQRRLEYLDFADTELQLIAIEYKVVGDHYKYEKPRTINDDSANVTCGNICVLKNIMVSLEEFKFKVNEESQKFHGELDSAEDVAEAIM